MPTLGGRLQRVNPTAAQVKNVVFLLVRVIANIIMSRPADYLAPYGHTAALIADLDETGSLSAAKAAGIAVSPRQIFEHKTIRAIAHAAESAGIELPNLAEPADARTGSMPLSPVADALYGLVADPADLDALLAKLRGETPNAAEEPSGTSGADGFWGETPSEPDAPAGGDFWGELFRQFWRTLGMFFVRGDRIWRHNVPWRPIFDPILSVAFVIGLVVVLRRARSDAAGGFLLVWIGAMAMPTFLAEDAPHFLRSVGVLPFAAFLPALGIDWIVCRSRSVRLRALIAVLFLLFAATSTVRAYFWDYARTPTAAYWFEQGATSLAGRVNGFLGSGWDGRRMVRSGTGERCVVIDARLWNEWPQVRFLVGQEYSPAQDYLSLGRPAVGRPVGVFVWPYDDWRWAWELLPTPAEVIVEQGALSQGDLDPEPYTTYVAFLGAPPAAETPSAMARFTSGIELLAVETASMPDGRIRVRLVWRAPTGGPAPAEWQTEALLQADYTVFLHYLRDGERVAQADSPPAQGYYPTTQWRLGDVVNDDHFVVLDAVGEAREPIPGRDVVRFGFWQPESGAVLPLLDDAGNAVGDWVEVPVR